MRLSHDWECGLVFIQCNCWNVFHPTAEERTKNREVAIGSIFNEN